MKESRTVAPRGPGTNLMRSAHIPASGPSPLPQPVADTWRRPPTLQTGLDELRPLGWESKDTWRSSHPILERSSASSSRPRSPPAQRKASEHWKGHSSLHPPSPKQSAWKNFVRTRLLCDAIQAILDRRPKWCGRGRAIVTAAACRARLSRQARSEPLSKRTLATTEAATLRQKRLSLSDLKRAAEARKAKP
jgi:hypothetical protein